VIDSQTVRAADTIHRQQRATSGKTIKGRKRHVAVDRSGRTVGEVRRAKALTKVLGVSGTG
jgi:hypothetical protein